MLSAVAVDECLEGSHNCGAGAGAGSVAGQCIDLVGSFTCKCPDGYYYNADTGGCDGETQGDVTVRHRGM
jgi:hypothetical protein